MAVLIYLPVTIDLRTHVESTTMVAMATANKYRLDAEARCLRKIETRGAVECGVPSGARALPTCPEGFNFT